MNAQRGAKTYRDDPAWVFTLRIPARLEGEQPIVVRAFEIFEHPDRSRDHLTGEVVQDGAVVFPRGQLWIGSPISGWRDGLDSREARDAILSLVGMAPGDTDAEYFASYSDEQRAWASEHADWLYCERERRYGSSAK